MITERKLPAGLITRICNARHAVFFTGAGISKASGVPTFRDGADGTWNRLNWRLYATLDGFKNNREEVWKWYELRRLSIHAASPNDGHLGIANFEKLLPKVTVITQNVDDLHERAGSQSVIHLHGSLFSHRCAACAHPHTMNVTSPEGQIVASTPQPRCTRCGGWIRPGVVWFGEGLPEADFANAVAAVNDCDLFFSIGTSLDVYPAANLAFMAAKRPVCVVQVNPQKTVLNDQATFTLKEKAEKALPAILQAISEGSQHV